MLLFLNETLLHNFSCLSGINYYIFFKLAENSMWDAINMCRPVLQFILFFKLFMKIRSLESQVARVETDIAQILSVYFYLFQPRKIKCFSFGKYRKSKIDFILFKSLKYYLILFFKSENQCILLFSCN